MYSSGKLVKSNLLSNWKFMLKKYGYSADNFLLKNLQIRKWIRNDKVVYEWHLDMNNTWRSEILYCKAYIYEIDDDW